MLGAFLFYLAYKLVFQLILPVYRTTKKVRRGFRDLQERMEQAPGAYPPPQQQQPASGTKGGAGGEYIEFEEVK